MVGWLRTHLKGDVRISYNCNVKKFGLEPVADKEF